MADSAVFQELYQKLTEAMNLPGVRESGKLPILAGEEAIRSVVREELAAWNKGPAASRAGEAPVLQEQVLRVIDKRIEQFLIHHLKTREFTDRVSSIAKSEARLAITGMIEQTQQDLEQRVAREIESAADDLLRSAGLEDRVRKLAGDFLASQAPKA